MAATSPPTSSRKVWPPSAWMPVSERSWLAAITSAAAEVNPLITECESRSTTEPSRNAPSTSWIAPTSSARAPASAT
jgi:hypothetical protein